jgi:cytochrome P450
MNRLESGAELDPFSEVVLRDPYPFYRSLRDDRPVAWFPGYGTWMLSRYEHVREALGNDRVFSSAGGVGLNEVINGVRHNIIQTDPPEHDTLRAVLAGQLGPRSARQLRERVRAHAVALVDDLVRRGTFEAVEDVATALPATVIIDLVGYPERGRRPLSELGKGTFDAFGPANDRLPAAVAKFGEMMAYLTTAASPEQLRPGSMGAAIYQAADRGEVDAEQALQLMVAYTTAGLDTTMSAIGTAIHLFGTHPGQWDLIRADPSRARTAFNEVLRYESPIQWFARTLRTDYEVAGIRLAEGDRVVLSYGSANRDERRWSDPDGFDVTRDAGGQLSFGYGRHFCAGAALARLEFEELFTALATRVRRFHVGPARWPLHNVLRGLSELPTRLELDD